MKYYVYAVLFEDAPVAVFLTRKDARDLVTTLNEAIGVKVKGIRIVRSRMMPCE